MQFGTLFYNSDCDRMDIHFLSGEKYGGLHCGETFDVFYGGQWISTRIEKSDDWYLVGIKSYSLHGLRVRK